MFLQSVGREVFEISLISRTDVRKASDPLLCPLAHPCNHFGADPTAGSAREGLLRHTGIKRFVCVPSGRNINALAQGLFNQLSGKKKFAKGG